MRKRIMLIIFLCFIIFLLSACTHKTHSNYYQENYGLDCIYTSTIRDELDLCLAKSLKQEHIQNDLVNSFSE